MGKYLLPAFVWLVMGFILLPVVYVGLSSFNASAGMEFPPLSYSLRWYGQIPNELWQSLFLSLEIASAVAVLSALLGGGIAIAAARHRGMSSFISGYALAPLTVPTLVLGVALYQFAISVRLSLGISLFSSALLIVLGHLAITIPYAVRTVLVSQSSFDRSLEEASLSLGIPPLATFWKVTLRLLIPGFTAGFIFSFLVSLDDVPVALMTLGGETSTLPVKILGVIEYNFSPSVMALSSLLILGCGLIVIILHRLIRLERLFGLE